MKSKKEIFDGQPFNGKTLESILAQARVENKYVGFCFCKYEKDFCQDCPTLKGCLELRDKEIAEQKDRRS